MYSERIILANLDEFARQEGWMPEYHTIDQIEEFKAYLNSVTKIERNSRNAYVDLSRRITEARKREIRRWIENEQVLCGLDSSYWETRYAWICDEQGEVYRFKNRDSQKVFDAVVAQFEEMGVSLELLILKARQQGISTKVALKFLHRLMNIPHTAAVMASVDDKKSALLQRIVTTCLERQPWWLCPKRTKDREGDALGFDNGSLLSIQSGKQATGIAQGWTPTLVHISELADIPNAKKVIEEGLLRATHSSRKLFLVLEGTGGGNTGWLADKWRTSKEDFPKGKARLCPMFIPWPLAPDLYPEKDWIRKFPAPAGWKPMETTRKHVRRCELYIRNTSYLAKICGANWKMPIEQQWFWEFNYLEAVKTHTTKIWFAQMPADDLEALQGTHDTVFSGDVIEVASKERTKEYQDYAITGDSIDDGFEPLDEEIDFEQPRLRVSWTSHRGQKYQWTMIPLLPVAEDDEKLSLDRMRIFEAPGAAPGFDEEARFDFSLGVDTADGLGKEDEERFCASLTRNMGDDGQDVQCAEMVSNRINPAQAVGFVACLAAFYHPWCKDERGVKFCIEQRTRPGDDCQFQLKLMGFSYHHIPTRYDDKSPRENKGNKQGWFSNSWSVPMLMGRFIDAVNGGWYKPQSKWLIEEMRTLERKTVAGNKSKLEHQSGKFDDRVRAAAQSFFTRHAFDVLVERAQKRYSLPSEKNPPQNYEECSIGQVSVGDM